MGERTFEVKETKQILLCHMTVDLEWAGFQRNKK